MSVRIGAVSTSGSSDDDTCVYASRAGVEILSDPRYTLDPIQARNLAALLVRGADEVERMRERMGSGK